MYANTNHLNIQRISVVGSDLRALWLLRETIDLVVTTSERENELS
jgi:hypothetical protein